MLSHRTSFLMILQMYQRCIKSIIPAYQHTLLMDCDRMDLCLDLFVQFSVPTFANTGGSIFNEEKAGTSTSASRWTQTSF